MPDKPAAELNITGAMVRALVDSQVPDAASLRLTPAGEGWDCAVWRLGDALAVRLPRREAAAALVVHEQAVLPSIAARLAASGVGVPLPVVSGRPGHGFPWPWSVVPWFEGTAGLAVARALRSAWALPLATALCALHVPAADGFPRNPVRGVPLRDRAQAVDARLSALHQGVDARLVGAARAAWDAALDATPWQGPPTWIHGDVHPGNLIARGSELVAIIDFGDVTAGDPAYDLAVAWVAFDASGRRTFIDAFGDRYNDATWIRARGWAAAIAVLLLNHSDDNPTYAALGAEALREVAQSSV